MSCRRARIMRAFVSSHCITCSRTHDSVDPAVVIACTRQTELDFGNRGTPAGRDTLVTGLIVRIVSVSVAVRIIPIRIIPVRIVSVVGIKERITKITEENEFIEVAMAEPIAIPRKFRDIPGPKRDPAPAKPGVIRAGAEPPRKPPPAPAPLNPPPLKPPPAEPPCVPASATEALKVIAATQLVNRICFVFINKLASLIN